MNNKDFSDWLEKNRNLFYQEARRYFSNWDDIEEAAQIAQVRLWQRASKGGVVNMGGSARVVTRYVCLEIIGRKQRRGEISYDNDPTSTLADTLAALPYGSAVEQCDLRDIPWFDALTPNERGVAILLYQGHSERAAAEMLHCSRRDVSYTKEKLRKKLHDRL